MVSSLLSLAVVSMAGLAQARSDLFQRHVNDECCPCPVSGSPTPQSPVTVTVTQHGPATPDAVTVYVTQGNPGPSENVKETITVKHTVTAPGTTIYVGGSVPAESPRPPQTNLPGPGHGNPAANYDRLQTPSVITHTVFLPKQSAQIPQTRPVSVTTVTATLPQDNTHQPEATGLRPSSNTLPPNNSNGSGPDNSQNPNGHAPNIQAPNSQAPSNQTPNNQTPNNQAPNNQTPNNQALNNQTPNNQAPNNQAPNNQAPNNQAPNNQAPNNQAPNNQVPNNQAPNGQAPNSQASINQTPDNQRPGNQAPTIQTVTVGQAPYPSVQTVTVTQGTTNSQPANSASIVTVTAMPNPQSVPPYVQHPELYQTVTQTTHNGDTTNIEINMINIFNGNTFCIVQGSNSPCGNNVGNNVGNNMVVNNINSPQTTTSGFPRVVTAAAPSSMATTTSCPPARNSTSIATVYNTVTATISQGRGANDTSGSWAARPTGAARFPRNPMRKLW